MADDTVIDPDGAAIAGVPWFAGEDLQDRFEVGRRIGSGGMAEVFAAVCRTTRRPVALKRIKPELAHRGHIQDRFANEVDLLDRCRGPYVLELVAASRWGDVPAFVAERCSFSLHDIARDRPLPALRALAYAAETLAALDRVHQLGIVHRDIKPSNLLIAADGSLRLADFGIARHPDRRLTRVGRRVGTPNYAAPDLVADPRAAVPAHDLFAVGLLLFAVTTHLRTSTLTEAGEERARALARLPPAFAQLLDRATALDPTARYEVAAEMALDVQRASEALKSGLHSE